MAVIFLNSAGIFEHFFIVFLVLFECLFLFLFLLNFAVFIEEMVGGPYIIYNFYNL